MPFSFTVQQYIRITSLNSDALITLSSKGVPECSHYFLCKVDVQSAIVVRNCMSPEGGILFFGFIILDMVKAPQITGFTCLPYVDRTCWTFLASDFVAHIHFSAVASLPFTIDAHQTILFFTAQYFPRVRFLRV